VSDPGRAVREDLGGTLGHGRCGEAHVDDGIGAQLLRLHAADGLLARLDQQLRVALEFTADDVLESEVGRSSEPVSGGF